MHSTISRLALGLWLVAATALPGIGAAAQATAENGLIAAKPSAVAAANPTAQRTAFNQGITVKKRVARRKARKPLLLAVPRLTLGGSYYSSFGSLPPSFSQSPLIATHPRDAAADVADDISLFRFRLAPEWRVEWDFRRPTLPAERQVLGLNVGLYHAF